MTHPESVEARLTRLEAHAFRTDVPAALAELQHDVSDLQTGQHRLEAAVSDLRHEVRTEFVGVKADLAEIKGALAVIMGRLLPPEDEPGA